MAEDTKVAGTDDATQESSEPSSNQLSDLTLDEIAEALQSRLWPAFQSHTSKSTDALRKELLPFLEEGKQTTALVRALARGDVLTEEQLESMDKARAEARRIQELEETNARLLEKTQALEKRDLTYDEVDKVLEQSFVSNLVSYARDQGLISSRAGWDQLWALGVLPTERKASNGDEHGILKYEAESRQAIRKAADAKLHDEEPPPNITQARGAGAGSPEDAYRKWLKGEGPKPPDAEIDRLTASYR